MNIISHIDTLNSTVLLAGVFGLYYISWDIIKPIFKRAKCIREYYDEKAIIQSGNYNRDRQGRLHQTSTGKLLLFGDIILDKKLDDRTPIISGIRNGMDEIDNEILKPARRILGIKDQANGKGAITNTVDTAMEWSQKAVLDAGKWTDKALQDAGKWTDKALQDTGNWFTQAGNDFANLFK